MRWAARQALMLAGCCSRVDARGMQCKTAQTAPQDPVATVSLHAVGRAVSTGPSVSFRRPYVTCIARRGQAWAGGRRRFSRAPTGSFCSEHATALGGVEGLSTARRSHAIAPRCPRRQLPSVQRPKFSRGAASACRRRLAASCDGSASSSLALKKSLTPTTY